MSLSTIYSNNRYFALKILSAYATDLQVGNIINHPHYHEADIMKRVSQPTRSPGAKHCLQFVEWFLRHSQETGTHQCIVMEPASLPLSRVQARLTTNDGLPNIVVKRMMKQLCLALDYLHTECRVVHTGERRGTRYSLQSNDEFFQI